MHSFGQRGSPRGVTTISRKGQLLAAITLSLTVADGAWGDVLFISPELQMNAYTTGPQIGTRAGAVDCGLNAECVVVWDSAHDGSGFGVFGRDANDLTPEFQANTYTTFSQVDGVVTANEDGSFVVVWTEASGQDGYSDGVFGQRFDSTTAPIGTEFQVNTFTTAAQFGPSVVSATDGGFLVVWSSFGQDGDSTGIFGQVFDNVGDPAGTEFQVNSYTTSFQSTASAAALGGTEFVVVWRGNLQDGDGYGIFGQRLDDLGTAVGSEFQVNSVTAGDQSAPAVAASGSGFVVIWEGTSDGDGSGVSARRFDGAANPVGTEFQVNQFTTGDQLAAAVAADTGGFVAAWESEGQDGDGDGVFARRYDAAGSPDGTEFQVNTYTTGDQGVMTSVGGVDGSFGIVWASDGQDGDTQGVFAQVICVDADSDGDCDVQCDSQPAEGCRLAAADKSQLALKNKDDDAKDQLKWKWKKGDETLLAAFKDPVGGTADYLFCVYDQSPRPQPLSQTSVAPGGTCLGAPCWKPTGDKGFKYLNKGESPSGVALVSLKAGEDGKAQVQVKGKGENLGPPELPTVGSVVAQILISDGVTTDCWQTTYASTLKNDGESFKAKGP